MSDEALRAAYDQAKQEFVAGNYGNALALLDKLAQEFPSEKEILYSRAQCLAKLGRVEEASAACDQLTTIYGDPRGEQLKDTLAVAHGSEERKTPDAADNAGNRSGASDGQMRRKGIRSVALVGGIAVAIALLLGLLVFLRAPEPGEVRTFAGIEFVWIPPGEYVMGPKAMPEKVAHMFSSLGEAENQMASEVEPQMVLIANGFWLSKYEVTQRHWVQVMDQNPSQNRGSELPVDQVSWEDCQEYLRRLNGLGQGTFRAPTEAEWEWACRAGSEGEFHFGDDASQLADYAWLSENSQGTSHRVGGRKPNAWGLHDMHGNVHELCRTDSQTRASATRDKAPCAHRSGSYLDNAGFCRVTSRRPWGPNQTSMNIGFRLARETDGIVPDSR